MRRALIALLVMAVVVIAILVIVSVAMAHGPADWINRGQYKNRIGELCCGERDCHELSSSDVRETPVGYLIVSTHDLVLFEDATPSPTGTYWLCQSGGRRRCFFYPPSSM